MREFFEELNAIAGPGRRDIIEKDYHLHRLLNRISRDEYLSGNLVFKGGTCLIKAHLGYYRFSEDIDFTWKDTRIWRDRSPSETRRLCSQETDTLLSRFKVISRDLGLDFSGDKTDKRYVHMSSGGRMAVFFLGYHSEMLDRPERIKVEINFVDKTLYPHKKSVLRTYVETVEKEEIKFLYPEPWREYTARIELDCYDPREIFIEKCRAALTRKAYKLRDMIDIYHLEKEYGHTIRDYREDILDKTRFMLDLYKRYQENIELLELPEPNIQEEEEMKLMIQTPPPDLQTTIERIHREMKRLREEIVDTDTN